MSIKVQVCNGEVILYHEDVANASVNMLAIDCMNGITTVDLGTLNTVAKEFHENLVKVGLLSEVDK